MYWLRKFYGPTIFFAPEGAAAPDPDEVDTADDADADTDDTDDGTDTTDDDAGTDDTDADDTDSDEGDDADGYGVESASRRESRNARQARENRELREKLARLEGENGALKTNGKPVDTELARRQREEKIALMSNEERMAFEAKEETAALRTEARATQFMVLDMQDKNAYDVLCLKDPVAEKHKAEVEKLLAGMRGNNTNAPRETLLNYVIGKHAREQAMKPGNKKKLEQRKQEASTRVSQAKAKPMSGRGDSGTPGKDEGSLEALRQKLLDRERRGDVN